MLEIDSKKNKINNIGVAKVGHLHKNIKFNCDNDIKQCSTDLRNEYLNNYIKVLERILKGYILFDFLNIGLKDLGNNNVEKILESKQKL